MSHVCYFNILCVILKYFCLSIVKTLLKNKSHIFMFTIKFIFKGWRLILQTCSWIRIYAYCNLLWKLETMFSFFNGNMPDLGIIIEIVVNYRMWTRELEGEKRERGEWDRGEKLVRREREREREARRRRDRRGRR